MELERIFNTLLCRRLAIKVSRFSSWDGVCGSSGIGRAVSNAGWTGMPGSGSMTAQELKNQIRRRLAEASLRATASKRVCEVRTASGASD
jgi:NAD(P)H-dependent flavin oxidoreductase YrpB (nitropropane dioxygenase family)